MSEFKVGDFVVAIEGFLCKELFEINRVGINGELFDTKWRLLNPPAFRHATTEEIKAERRLP